MNKRLLCLLLSFVMLMSVLLTGCSKDKAEIPVNADKNTMSLTMYLMSEEEVSEEQEKKMEEAANLILKSKFKVQLDLRYYTPDKYYEAVSAAMKAAEEEKAEKAAAEKAEKDALKNNGGATKATKETEVTEEATIINELGIPELAYPTVGENQVDIFYVGGYDNLNMFVNKNWAVALDDAIAGESKIIADYVSETYLTYVKKLMMGGTYMIPSNLAVGEYTYLLLNKDILAKYNYSSTKGFSSLTSDNVKDVLANVHAYDPDYLPLYSGTGELDLLDVTYYGVDANGNLTYDFSVMGGRCDPSWTYMTANNFYDFHNVFTSSEFKAQMRILTEYRLNGYYGTEADADKPFAVGYVKGPAELAEVYGEEYELVVLAKPKMSTEELFSHGFAVGPGSSDVKRSARSMEVITYINTNEDFRNLLLYGIEGDNYEIVEKEVDGVTYKTVNRLNNSYMMAAEKTGNITLAYPTVDELPNLREYQKVQNRDTSVMLDLGFILEKDDPKDKLYNGVTDIADMDPAALQKLLDKGMSEAEIEEKIAEGVVKEEEDAASLINVTAMGKLAELSEQLKNEMLAVESLEELETFFTYAENKVAKDQYFMAMVNINYNNYYPSYNPEANGVGCGFANLYKAWLDMHGLWKE